jgi:hypothetical protein
MAVLFDMVAPHPCLLFYQVWLAPAHLLFFKESKTKKEEKGASYLPSFSIAFSQLNHDHMTLGR